MIWRGLYGEDLAKEINPVRKPQGWIKIGLAWMGVVVMAVVLGGLLGIGLATAEEASHLHPSIVLSSLTFVTAWSIWGLLHLVTRA